jgi:glycosyltransferase involved in cell wall biosynthesis
MKKGYKKVIYFDPDIKLFGSINPMLELLDDHNVLLTPHLTNLLDDGKLPSELGILQAGSYNLGYIGLSNTQESLKLVKWWQSKLYKECVVDLSRGLFVDQKWMDMVPSLFSGVYICRDEGWNVAYWNLNHRNVEQHGETEFFVNDRPLVFFHFSGYSIEAKTLSKHQNRFDKSSNGEAVERLCEIYNDCLTRNGIGKYKAIPYAYGTFNDGTPIPDVARLVIKDDPFFDDLDLFNNDDLNRAYRYFNEKVSAVSNSVPKVTRITEMLWKSRDDLRAAFPNIYETDALRFLDWVIHSAENEANFSPVFVNQIRTELEAHQIKAIEVPNSQTTKKFGATFIKKIWLRRDLIRLALGKRVANWAFKRAFSGAAPVPVDSYGINLIGYVHAESGVGEAARSSIRGIEKADIPKSIIDYRVGNVSRMSEKVSAEFEQFGSYSINLVHVNADQSGVVREHLPDVVFENRYTIGYWYWEMPVFPDFLDFAFDNVDEIWVATDYILNAVSNKTSKPVKLIPPNVSVVVDESLGRADFGLEEGEFVFFHMSDVLSMPERKNPLAVIQAFKKAFADQPSLPVKLLLKITNLDRNPELEAEINELVANDSRISLIFGYMERTHLNSLIANIDCYVSLHRAEGFGLPIAEAMSLGKIVIATMWSGNVDFMSQDNSLPVSYELVELEEDVGPYEKGQIWAEPSIDDAADKMFHIFNDEQLQASIGKAAKQTISEFYSPSASGKAMKQRLKELCQGLL